MTIEEVDACTGPAVGWPNSATFRTADIVGLDVLVSRHPQYLRQHSGRRIARNVPRPRVDRGHDEARMARRKNGRRILQAREGRRGRIGNPDARLAEDGIPARGRKRDSRPSRPGRPSRTRASGCACSPVPRWRARKATRPIVSCGPVSARCAFTPRGAPRKSPTTWWMWTMRMCWGFGWELGPFEMWDAIGVERDGEGSGARREADSAGHHQGARFTEKVVL